MLKNNYSEFEQSCDKLDEGFLRFIDYGNDKDFSYETRNAVYQETKNTNIPIIGLQADGIVNGDFYGKNNIPKILVLMYESYRINDGRLDYIWNEASWLRFENERPKKMFGVVHKWIQSIFDELGVTIKEKQDNLLHYCAWMNISKLGRKTAKKDGKILQQLVQSKDVVTDNSYIYPCCGERLAEQFLYYDPDIVICGNTKTYMEEFLNVRGVKYKIIDKWQGEEKTNKGRNRLDAYKYDINGKEMLLFDAYHPSAGRGNDTKSENFRNIIRKNNLTI